jgi:gluconokinase
VPAIPLAEAAEPFAVAVDIGSSSVRALLFDRLGRVVDARKTQFPYEMRTTPDGGVDVDADRLLELTCTAVDGLLAQAGAAVERVACVGVSCFWHSLMGVDAAGTPTTPVFTWADTRSAFAADDLRGTLDERAYHARTGAMLHTSYWPAKLLWLSTAEPAAVERTERWMSFAEYMYLRLFDRAACSTSMASGTGLFDSNALAWDAATLSALAVRPGQLPDVTDAACVGLMEPFAARWPALSRVPWMPAAGDGALSNVGSGCVTPAHISLMIGTSGAMRAVLRAASVAIPPGLWTYRLDRARFVVGGALSEGGGVFAWLLSLFKLAPDDALEAAIAAAEPDGHGLTVLPFAAGERSPGWATHARAAVVGLTLDTEPVDIVRAALESVAYRFSLIARQFPSIVPPDAEVVGSGGALLRSNAWAQIIADVLGRPVRLSAEEEASSRGAALTALEAIGAVDDLEALPAARGSSFEPDAGRHARYLAAVDRQRELYETLVAAKPAAPSRT